MSDDCMTVAEADALLAQYRPTVFRLDPGGVLTMEAHHAIMATRTRSITDRASERPFNAGEMIAIRPAPRSGRGTGSRIESRNVMPAVPPVSDDDCGRSWHYHRHHGTVVCEGCRKKKNRQKAESKARRRLSRRAE
jgi:hypothetical protein